MSDSEVLMLKQLLCRVKASGELHKIFGEMGDDVGELFLHGELEDDHVIVGMTDASKRRRSPETSARSDAASSQLPVMPMPKVKPAASGVPEMPLDPLESHSITP